MSITGLVTINHFIYELKGLRFKCRRSAVMLVVIGPQSVWLDSANLKGLVATKVAQIFFELEGYS